MDIQAAGNFLGASLLFGAGFAFIGIVIIFLNNIIYKYWKPLYWFKFLNFNDSQQVQKKDMKEPVLEEKKIDTETKV